MIEIDHRRRYTRKIAQPLGKLAQLWAILGDTQQINNRVIARGDGQRTLDDSTLDQGRFVGGDEFH